MAYLPLVVPVSWAMRARGASANVPDARWLARNDGAPARPRIMAVLEPAIQHVGVAPAPPAYPNGVMLRSAAAAARLEAR
jgi:hypothetical protein